jgi:hypothetical protein
MHLLSKNLALVFCRQVVRGRHIWRLACNNYVDRLILCKVVSFCCSGHCCCMAEYILLLIVQVQTSSNVCIWQLTFGVINNAQVLSPEILQMGIVII